MDEYIYEAESTAQQQIESSARTSRRRSSCSLSSTEVRSCFSMPGVSSADPTQLQTLAKRDGDEYALNGHKWFTSGAIGAEFAIVMAATDPTAAPHQRASQILVPTDTPGFAQMYQNVCDRAIQTMGALGVSDDTPVAALWRHGRSLRIADGPDEVHKMVIARRELRTYA